MGVAPAELVEFDVVTETSDLRRAEFVAVLSCAFVCSCMMLNQC